MKSKLREICLIGILLLFPLAIILGVSAESQMGPLFCDGYQTLKGEWSFYWQELLVSEPSPWMSQGQSILLPRTWTKVSQNQTPLPGGGYASYKRQLPDSPSGEYVLLVPNLAGAYRIYLNGALVTECGDFSKDPGMVLADNQPEATPFVVKDGESYEVIVECASQKSGGLYRAPVMVPWNLYQTQKQLGLAVSLLVLGGLFVIFLLGLFFYFFMEVRTYHFAFPVLLFTLLVGFACTAERFPLLRLVFPFISYEDIELILLAVFYIQWLACISYINQFFHLEMHPYTIVALSAFHLFLFSLYLWLPQPIYTQYFRYICPFAAFMSGFVLAYQFYEKLRQKKKHLLNAAAQTVCIQIELGILLLFWDGLLGAWSLWLTVVCIFVFSLLFLWSYAQQVSRLYEDNQHIVKMQAEVTQANIRLLLSQIRPHFLYNTLNAICALCRTDPHLAEKAIIQFSKYLKANMNAIEKTEPVLFEEELTHIQSYVWIEQLRLDDRLKVVFDLQETEFYIPILSVEPLVENAIRHGISKQREGGTVTIRTYKDWENYYIQVIDDGVGFEDGEISQYHYERLASTGIKNVANRLSIMMHGELKIESQKGVGTTATIILPIEDNYTGPFELIYRTRKGELIRCVL